MLRLGGILRRHARDRSAKTAYVLGEARVTYGEFHRRSNQIARALQRRGVRRGDRVAVLANNVPDYPLLYFAAIKLGAILVPINARFRADEIAVLLRHCGPTAFLAADEFAALAAQLRADPSLTPPRSWIGIESDRLPGGLSLRGLADGESAADVEAEAEVDEHDPHVMLYTSGTTGAPKGALLTHRAYYLQEAHSQLNSGLGEDDVGLCMFPMYHMGGWAMPLGFWFSGSTIVILRKADPRLMLETVEREKITYLYAVPSIFSAMLRLPDFERYDLGSLHTIASGTAAMTRTQVFEIIARFRCSNMFILYGSTEAGPVAALRPRFVAHKPETVGRPFPGVEVKVVDPTGAEVAAGVVGEITVRSEFTMRGYWRQPEETARVLDAHGWARTSDLGVIDEEGFLSVVGRLKEVIRSAGENIFPAEIERVLLAHPQIAEAAAVGVPDPDWGEAVAVAIVLRDGGDLDAQQVVDYVRTRLASFKKPRHVVFVDQLPRTPASRQVQKPLLREMILRQIGS
jgi:fatty-acyl-CoA synthase